MFFGGVFLGGFFIANPATQEALSITLREKDVPAGLRYALTDDLYRYAPASRSSCFRSTWIREPRGGARLQATAAQAITNQQRIVDSW